jgi:hypothetical protein
MPNESKTGNTFVNILGFYESQLKKLQPVIKQGIEDAYHVYNKIWMEQIKLQDESVKKWARNDAASSYVQNAKIFGEQIIRIQKDTTHAMADITIKSVLSVIEISKKITV